VGGLEPKALITGGIARAFAEIQRDARGCAMQLIREVAIELLDRGHDIAK
jgi:hypothetical protein